MGAAGLAEIVAVTVKLELPFGVSNTFPELPQPLIPAMQPPSRSSRTTLMRQTRLLPRLAPLSASEIRTPGTSMHRPIKPARPGRLDICAMPAKPAGVGGIGGG